MSLDKHDPDEEKKAETEEVKEEKKEDVEEKKVEEPVQAKETKDPLASEATFPSDEWFNKWKETLLLGNIKTCLT